MAENRHQGMGARVGRALLRSLEWLWALLRGQVVVLVGGPARARVIAMFGAVLALSGADAATVGAVAPQLEQALHIGNAKIGLLTGVGLLVGALFVIPVGLLVDRVKRIPLLSISIVLWSVASLLSAFADSYGHLLLTRLALGAVTATAGPAIASLTGDYFPARERGRVYAYILGGETVGTAAGFIVSGSVASLISWRVAFVLLAIPGLFLARTLWRTVPEPRRGGQSWLEPGAVEFWPPPEAEFGEHSEQPNEQAPPPDQPPAPPDEPAPGHGEPTTEQPPPDALAHAAASQRGAQPHPERVLKQDPSTLRLVPAIRYILSIPTNLLLIIGSSLGYFYFAGLQTFGLLFVRGHYHVNQATSELGLGLLILGALVGTLLSGQLTDRLLRRGVLEARVWIPAGCYLGAVLLLIPGILGGRFTPALWFDVGGAALLAAANPPLDAARLDIMPAGLWGRAESVRTFLRSVVQALAPLAFGGLAELIAGIVPSAAPIGTHPQHATSSATTGLQITFLIMLAVLAAAGLALLRARHTYAEDVATAAAAPQGTAEGERAPQSVQW